VKQVKTYPLCKAKPELPATVVEGSKDTNTFMNQSNKNPFDLLLDSIRQVVAEEVAKAIKGSKEDRLVDIDELCKVLSVEKAWVYHNTKRLPFARKVGGNLRFSNNDLQRWIQAQRFSKRAKTEVEK
jgi:predicted DNA-binding transcriptional regulator AlpA